MSKNKTKEVNPYGNFKPSDSNFLNKVDAKIADFQKQNKKYALDFYYNAKQFVLNAIEMKKQYKADELNKLPKRFLDLINDRDIDKLYNGFLNDTKAVAKVLFSEEMSMEEVCACAIEYVRLCSCNFNRFESESERKKESEIVEKFSVGYNGVMSFYFGLASNIDRGQLLARLINCGIDIKHSIAYCECVVDAYGDPITQIIEFKGKPMVAISAYNGVVKTYNKNIDKLSNLYQFLDFGESIDMGRKRALQAFKKFHNLKNLLNKTGDLAKSLEEVAKVGYQNLSNLSPCEQTMIVNTSDRVVTISTLFELSIYERQKEYELIPDLFDANIATIKLKQDDTSRFKVFPNKVLDEEYNLNNSRSYILNKGNKTEKEEDLPNDDFSESLAKLDEQTEMEMQKESSYKPVSLDDVQPVPAVDVLNNLQVKFTPKEDSERIFDFDGATFDFSQAEMLALGETQSVDLDQAEKERLMFEKEMGIESNTGLVPPQASKKKKKSFYDVLDEISEKVEKSRATKLQERYAEMQSNNQLNAQNNSGNVDNNNEEIDFNQQLINEAVNESDFAENSDIVDENDNYSGKFSQDNDENQQFGEVDEELENDEIEENLDSQENNLLKEVSQQTLQTNEDIEMNPDYLKYEEEYDDYFKEVNNQLFDDDQMTAEELKDLEAENESDIDDFEIFEMEEQANEKALEDSLEDETFEEDNQVNETLLNSTQEELVVNKKGETKKENESNLEKESKNKEQKKVEAEKQNGIKQDAISTNSKPKAIPKLPPKLPPKKQPPKLPKKKS